MEVKMQIQYSSPMTSDPVARTFGYVNRNYLGSLAVPYSVTPSPEAQIQGVMLPRGYANFFEWVDEVARGMSSLSRNNYRDAVVTGNWSVAEEMAG